MATLTHKKVSAIPDGSNSALVRPSDWNDAHNIPVTGVLFGDATTDELSAAAGTRVGQYLIQKFYQTTTQYEFRDFPEFIVTDYNFPAIVPVSNLVAATPTTLAISTNIVGIQSVSAGLHRLRIVDNNPALTEVVLLTAGTMNGSLVFTPANSHTAGQYTITSASSGIQECIAYATSRGGGRCFMPIGTYIAYNNIDLTMASGISIKLYGVSPAWSMVERHSSYVSGNVFTYSGAGRGNAALVLEDFRVLGANGFNNTGGYAIGVTNVDNARLFFNRVWVFDGNGGFLLQNASNVHMAFCQYLESADQVIAAYAAAEAGLRIIGTQSDLNFVSCTFQTQYRGALLNMLQNGIYINGVDGAQFVNCVSNGYYGVRVFAAGSASIINVWMVNHVCDECRWTPLQIEGSTTGLYTNLNFVKMHLNCQSSYAGGDPIVISGNADYINISMANGNLGATDGASIDASGNAYHGGPKQSIILRDCEFSANGLSNSPGTVGIRIAANSAGVQIKDCSISKRPGFTSDLTAAIAFDGAASKCSVTGCDLRDFSSVGIFIGGTLTGCQLENNPGVDNVIGTAASGATLTFPINPKFKVTGTTGVGTVSGLWAGRSGQLVTVDGAVTFTAGATIANTITTTQNRPINWFYDGTLLYLG